MGQIVKRKKKGRPSKADLARRPISPTPATESEVRRSLRRRNVRYDIDYYEDYFDEEDEDEEEERRREKKLKLVVKLNQRSDSAEPTRSHSRSSARAEHASDDEDEDEDEDDKPLKKRKINGGDFSESDDEEEENNYDEEEVSLRVNLVENSSSAEVSEKFSLFFGFDLCRVFRILEGDDNCRVNCQKKKKTNNRI